MAATRPWPLVQGELDGLCGPYSIINSLTWGLYSLQVTGHCPRQQSSPLGQREIEELFMLLIRRLTRKYGTRSVVDGSSSLQLARLLRRSGTWLSTLRGLTLTVVRPFYLRPRATMRQVCRVLANHLAGAGTAAIIGLEWPSRHWTVVIGVTPTRLYLLDSSDGPPHSSLRRQPRGSKTQRRLLRPREVFLLKLCSESTLKKSAR
jgi:hypothetical protein